MRFGWFYRSSDRTILYRATKGGRLSRVGTVPKVAGVIGHYTDDGKDIRSEIQLIGRRGHKRIVTEEDLDKGTWASKVGMRRPSSADAKQAFAIIIRRDADRAAEVPARTYYNDRRDLLFPDADAQIFGYLTLAGTEENARDVWDEIRSWASFDPHAALALGALFVGPALHALGVHAHILNCYGEGQQGKSTVQTTAAATMGDVRPRTQKLMLPWSSSKQGITQGLRLRGYLPLALEEHSSSGRTVKQAGPEFSQIVAGAMREMGGADGVVREGDGFWHSLLLSSSNEPLRQQGQVEALASRLQEISTPFFQNLWIDPDGNPTHETDPRAEHLSDRLKRLAESAGGWPLHWAIEMGMYRAENLARLKKRHMELCARYAPRSGGIPMTIAKLHMAWVVGAYMLGTAIGGEDKDALAEMAEQAAVERLQQAIDDAAEVAVSDGDKLWAGLESVRVEADAFPDAELVAQVAADPHRTVKGFIHHSADYGTEWWVMDSVVRQAAREYEVENLMQALRQLDKRGIHLRGDGKHAQRQVPPSLKTHECIPKRMHLFRLDKADSAVEGVQEKGSTEAGRVNASVVPTPVPTPEPTKVGTEIMPLTCDVPTVPTIPTFLERHLYTDSGPTPAPLEMTDRPEPDPEFDRELAGLLQDASAATVAAAETDAYWFSRGTQDGAGSAPAYPPAIRATTDQAFARIELEAEGWTRRALAFGVLGADETGPALLLPNRAPVRLALPESVNQVPALMDAYGLRTLWIHTSAALAMGLPTLEERRACPPVGHDQDDDDQEDQNLGVAGRMWSVGPQTPTAHQWADLDPAGPLKALTPGGLASWLTLVRPGQDGRRDDRLSVALPMYDTRLLKDRKVSGWGGATSAAELLDALMVWTVASSFTRYSRTEVIPYYASVNRTAQDFAGRGRTPEELEQITRCEAVRRQEIPCLIRNTTPLMVPQQWGRPLTEAEASDAVALHRFDKTAAWLGAFSSVELGIGEPVHAADGAEYNKRRPGFWRVAEIPGTGPAGLPPLVFRPDQERGGYWISTPSMGLLIELYPAWTPQVVEAWYWEVFKRAMSTMYERVRDTRLAIVAAAEAGRPGARWAKQIISRTYQSFRGYMARVDGPMTDHATGGDYRKDLYYRPDWARLIMDLATANMYRNLVHFHDEGVSALAVCVDALTFASTEADPEAARPPYMLTGKARWTHEGSAPIAGLLDALTIAEPGEVAHAHHVLNQYLNTPGE